MIVRNDGKIEDIWTLMARTKEDEKPAFITNIFLDKDIMQRVNPSSLNALFMTYYDHYTQVLNFRGAEILQKVTFHFRYLTN